MAFILTESSLDVMLGSSATALDGFEVCRRLRQAGRWSPGLLAGGRQRWGAQHHPGLGGSLKVPYGTVHNVLISLEHTALEPAVVDQKTYAPGLGIVMEQALAGGQEIAKLVKVTG